jgi:hypothetical protein
VFTGIFYGKGETMDFSLLWIRVLRAVKLDPNLYEEVEADRTALGQASIVVILASLAAGIGGIGAAGIGGLFILTVAALISWYVWALLTYLIGAKLLPEPQTSADIGQMLRAIGFASAPGMIRVLGIIPGLAAVVGVIAAVWMLVAMVIAVRQALDYTSTWRAVGVCLLGWIVQVVIFGLVFAVVGPRSAL